MDRKLELIKKILEDAQSDGWSIGYMSHYRRMYLKRHHEYIWEHFESTCYYRLFNVYLNFCAWYNEQERREARRKDMEKIWERKERVCQKALKKLNCALDGESSIHPHTSKGAIYLHTLWEHGIFWKYGIGEPLSIAGVYFLYGNKQLLYVGSSKNMRLRIKEHRREKRINFNSFKILPLIGAELDELLPNEYYYISELNPLLNIQGKKK